MAAPDEPSSNPYATSASQYLAAGWNPLPIPPKSKAPVPRGYTGYDGRDVTETDLEVWLDTAGKGDHNVALRMPRSVVGIDVDAYDEKVGAATLADLEALLGPLPPTWRSTSRPEDDVSGIRFFRVPEGDTHYTDAGDDIQTIWWGHRYAVVWPSLHPDHDGMYVWESPDGVMAAEPPSVADLPELPSPWVEHLKRSRSRGAEAVGTVIDLDFSNYRGRFELPEVIPEGKRGTTLHQYACSLVSRNVRDDERLLLMLEAFGRCDPPYTKRTPEWMLSHAAKQLRPTENTLDADLRGGATWLPLDLGPVVEGLLNGTLTRPEPTLGRLEDGTCLFYENRVNGVYGDPTAGKSWTALLTCAQVMEEGNAVLFIDYEDDKVGTCARLLEMGVPPGLIASHFIYMQPGEGFLNTPAARSVVEQVIGTRHPRLVVIDSTGESLAYDGVKSNADEDVALWVSKFPKRISRTGPEGRGPAVLLLDHRSKADSGLWPIGSQRKRAAITGAAYVQEATVPFSKTQQGFSRLVTSKDRCGNYPTGEAVAELHVMPGGATGEARELSIRLLPPGSPTAGNIRLSEADRVRRAVLWFVHDHPMCSTREVGQDIWPGLSPKDSGTRASATLKWLETAKAVTNSGARNKAAWSVLPGWDNKVPESFRMRA